MQVKILDTDHQYILNHCTKYLARSNTDIRHNYNNQFGASDPRGRICEAWRFPIIDSYTGKDTQESIVDYNRVTFIYFSLSSDLPKFVGVTGTFDKLYNVIALDDIKFLGESTGYYAVTLAIPKGEVHTYKFVIDNQVILDPINPQQKVLNNGQIWSQFFTHQCTDLLSLQSWEALLLERLTDHILPFRTEEGQRFLDFYYNSLDRQSKDSQFLYAYKFDQSIGVVNFIDKLLTKEERHHLIDYQICLDIIDKLLRQRNPFMEPGLMSKEMYAELYDQMFIGDVPGWNYSRYQSPKYFLQLLRRHSFTGAFSHPKYGGNAGGAGWAYLAERYPFNWRQSVEAPLGTNPDYRG
ncbi:hypothetical protein [Nostoc sp. C110]|uniref:hypothetical protein n=1 Tax=Nostoc sp. C110 TaxID=3349876 RepID=UPI00370DB7DE